MNEETLNLINTLAPEHGCISCGGNEKGDQETPNGFMDSNDGDIAMCPVHVDQHRQWQGAGRGAEIRERLSGLMVGL